MVPEPDRWDGMCDTGPFQPQVATREGICILIGLRARMDGYLCCHAKSGYGGGWVVPEPRNTEMPKRLSDGGDRQVRFPTPFAAAAPPLIGSW